ncbi:MAG: hypothetical protein RML75_00130 [Cyanobacteriota bacterium SKYGB_h_bin112]|nr:hypothetical protein [Cyanobacteriota bacterium SKYGB_h_bin112]
MVLVTVANSAVAAGRRPTGQIVQFSGGVLIKPQGRGEFRKPQAGQTLRAGDLLRVPPGAIAMVQCPNGLPIAAPADGNTRGFVQICPSVASNARSTELSLFQIGDPTSGRDASKPYIITPRQTIVVGARPTLAWYGPNRAASYQVKLFQVPWFKSVPFAEGETITTQLSYPTSDRDPRLSAGNYRFVVEAYGDKGFLLRQEQALPITSPPTVAKKLMLSWRGVATASRYLISLERSDVFWQTQLSTTRVDYPGQLPPTRYTLYVSDNMAAAHVDRQQFIVQDFSTATNELSNAKSNLDRLDRVTQVSNQPLTPVAKTLARTQIWAENFFITNAIAELTSLTRRDDQSIAVYRRLGELHQQVGLTILAGNYYTRALQLAQNQGDADMQAVLQAELACLAEERFCNP